MQSDLVMQSEDFRDSQMHSAQRKYAFLSLEKQNNN